MSILFIKSGLKTSIQDLGRFGYMHMGVSQSGAMDKVSMQMANWLVSKPLDSAVIEITLLGPVILFTKQMSIAICGAGFDCFLNNKAISNNQTIQVQADDRLQIKQCQSGIRAYLAFSGELISTKKCLSSIMKSYSTHTTAGFGGYCGRAFKDNDLLRIRTYPCPRSKILPDKYTITYSGNYLFRTVPSIETSIFNTHQCNTFYGQSFQVSADSDRMGIRLFGESLTFQQQPQITSTGLTHGSIQIPPDGQPIISSVDGQTLGGYPRIANVISADLPLLGQLRANDRVRFALIDKDMAISIYKEKKSYLDSLFLNNQ